jgi:hypothetical protein
MHRPGAHEFLLAVLESMEDLPPDLSRRFAELLKKEEADRPQAIRLLLEDLSSE